MREWQDIDEAGEDKKSNQRATAILVKVEKRERKTGLKGEVLKAKAFKSKRCAKDRKIENNGIEIIGRKPLPGLKCRFQVKALNLNNLQKARAERTKRKRHTGWARACTAFSYNTMAGRGLCL